MPGVGAVGDHRLERDGVERDRRGRRRRRRRVGSCRQRATRARPRPRPAARAARPARYSKVVSSGAIMPARAPASIDMLQTVMRSSIESARMAAPRYSMTWPVAPPMPMRAMSARIRSLAVTPGRSAPSTVDRERLRLALQQALGRQHVVDLAGADAEGERAERAVRAGVAVAADDGHAGLGEAAARARSRARCPAARRPSAIERDAELAAVRLERAQLRRAPRRRDHGAPPAPRQSSASSGPWSRRCDRAAAPAGRARAARRTPAARSPRGSGAGRRRARRACSVAGRDARGARPRSCRTACAACAHAAASPRARAAPIAER